MMDVSCAVIIESGKVLCVQRGAGRHLEGKWEFPGGKVVEGETPEDSAVREVREELDLEIEVLRALTPVAYSYPDKTVRLLPFICRVTGGVLRLHEHLAYRWLAPVELSSLDWCDADGPILEEITMLHSR